MISSPFRKPKILASHLLILSPGHLRGHVPIPVILSLANALVILQIRYCIAVYGFRAKQNLSRAQKVISYSAKAVFGCKKFDHVSHLLDRL